MHVVFVLFATCLPSKTSKKVLVFDLQSSWPFNVTKKQRLQLVLAIWVEGILWKLQELKLSISNNLVIIQNEVNGILISLVKRHLHPFNISLCEKQRAFLNPYYFKTQAENIIVSHSTFDETNTNNVDSLMYSLVFVSLSCVVNQQNCKTIGLVE